MNAPAQVDQGKASMAPAPVKKSVLLDMADRFGMEPAAFEATLRNTVVPSGSSKEQFAAFLLVAKEYNLNPLTKEIYAFPTKGGGIQPIVGIDGWANLINSHPAFDGMEFDDASDGNGSLVSVTCRMFRKDRSHPIAAAEYMAECKRPTEPWQKWPRRMLRHKAMIQAARYAFGFAGIVDPDEGERFKAESARDVTPQRGTRRRLSTSEAFDTYAGATDGAGQVIDHDDTTGEVTDVDRSDFQNEDQTQAAKTEAAKASPSDARSAGASKEAGAEAGTANTASKASASTNQETAAPTAKPGASAEAGASAEGTSEAAPASTDLQEDDLLEDGADRPWPPGTLPTNDAEYERYLDTQLASITDGSKVAGWWNSQEQKDLRTACKVVRFKDLQDKAIARRKQLSEKPVR